MALSDSTVSFYFNKPCWLCLQNTTRPKMLLTKSSTSPRITTVYCQDYRTPPSPNLKPRLSIAARVNLLKCASDGIISLLEILRRLLISEQSQGPPTLTPLHRLPCSALPASRLLVAIVWTQPWPGSHVWPRTWLTVYFPQVSPLKCHFSVRLSLATSPKAVIPLPLPISPSHLPQCSMPCIWLNFFIVFLPIQIWSRSSVSFIYATAQCLMLNKQ